MPSPCGHFRWFTPQWFNSLAFEFLHSLTALTKSSSIWLYRQRWKGGGRIFIHPVYASSFQLNQNCSVFQPISLSNLVFSASSLSILKQHQFLIHISGCLNLANWINVRIQQMKDCCWPWDVVNRCICCPHIAVCICNTLNFLSYYA